MIENKKKVSKKKVIRDCYVDENFKHEPTIFDNFDEFF